MWLERQCTIKMAEHNIFENGFFRQKVIDVHSPE